MQSLRPEPFTLLYLSRDPLMRVAVRHPLLVIYRQMLLFGVKRFLQFQRPPNILQRTTTHRLRHRPPLCRFLDLFEMVPKSHQGFVVHGLVDRQHREILHFYSRSQPLRQAQGMVVDYFFTIFAYFRPKRFFFFRGI